MPVSLRTAVWDRVRLGRSLMVLGVLGAVATILMTIVGWQFMGDLEDAVDESLAVGTEALGRVEEGLTLAGSVIGEVRDAVEPAREGVASTARGVRTVGEVLQTTSGVTAALPDQLDVLSSASSSLAEAVDGLDGVLGGIGLGSLPGASDLPRAARELETSIAAVRDDLGSLSTQLSAAVDDGRTLAAALDRLEASLETTRSNLDDAFKLLDESTAAVTRAQGVAGRAQHDVGRELSQLRALLVVLGLTVTFAHVLLYQFGRQLVARARSIVVEPPALAAQAGALDDPGDDG